MLFHRSILPRSPVRCLFAATLLVGLLCLARPTRGEDRIWLSYEPTVVTLSGTIVEEVYDEDASPLDQGKHAWIMRLDHPISVKGKPSDEIDVPEENVTEIHLNIDYSKYPAVKAGFGKTRFDATGTLYHSHTAHHLRAIVMLVSQLSAVK